MSNHSWPYRSLRPWIGLSDFVSSSGCCWICWVCHSMMPRKFHFFLFSFFVVVIVVKFFTLPNWVFEKCCKNYAFSVSNWF